MILKHENIRKIATCQGDDYPTGCLLDYPYFKENYKMIAIDIHQQQGLDADPKQFKKLVLLTRTENIDRTENTTMFFVIGEANYKNIANMIQNNLIFMNMKWLNAINSLNVKLSNPQLPKLNQK